MLVLVLLGNNDYDYDDKKESISHFLVNLDETLMILFSTALLATALVCRGLSWKKQKETLTENV